MLRIHLDTEHLDAVRGAFNCHTFSWVGGESSDTSSDSSWQFTDTFARVARLVIVAFALDGAKDELREGGVCGPRPVDCRDDPVQGESSFFDQRTSVLCRLGIVGAPAPLQRCLVAADVDGTSVEFFGVPEGAFASLTYLEVHHCGDADFANIVNAAGPALTHLHVNRVPIELSHALETCTNLRHLHVVDPYHGLRADEWSALCDALIASGAPLESIACFLAVPVDEPVRVPRRLRAISTVREVDVKSALFA